MMHLYRILLICAALFPTILLAKIKVEQSIIFPAQPGQPTAIFMRLHNNSNQEVSLAIAQSADKARLELHGTQNGKMLEVTGIQIPAQSTTELKRGGLHIMVFNLEKPLVVGDDYPISLFFDNGEIIDIKAKVVSP
ncbi:MAG: copper chaperone PCu(A)C [Pasteurella oralis]|uniref:copper chaperone PCu(A)C n=1 Tax=Pasteurella oralis TaxID=1071947 RepID=UPI002702B200|nr:copper chaperone PCu(A)C [Pasteurella oralis]